MIHGVLKRVGYIFILLLFIYKVSYATSLLNTIKTLKDTAVGLFNKDNVPKTVAVLPFVGEGTDEDKKELRITFNNHISSKKFENIKLDEIDEKLAILEKETGKKWFDLDNATLAKRLGVDGLFYAEVISIEKVYAGVYGSLSIKVKAKLVAGDTGELIWEKEESVAERSGGVPLSPWGAISTAISSALVLRDSVKISLMDRLFREMAKGIPEPKVAVVRKPPVIFSVITNAKDSPFRLNSEILVAMKGEPNCIGSFEIPDVAKNIPLTEIEPGNYVGKYIVNQGDNVKNKLMKVTLFSPKSKLENNFTVFHPIELDSIPPSEVKNLKVHGLKDRVQLSWKKLEDVKDFLIMRSETGEFVEIGVTQVPEFFDDNATVGKTYYYRVFARDLAGNLSQPAEIKFYYVKKGPTEVASEIKENLVLYKEGSPYRVVTNTVVSKGVEVTAEPGVIIELFDNVTLTVNGKVRLAGSISEKVTIKGKGYHLIVQDAGDAAILIEHAILEGGETLQVSNSGATFKNVEIRNYNKGLKIVRGGKVDASSLTIKQSHIGADIQDGNLIGTFRFEGNELAVNFVSGVIDEKGITFGKNNFYIKSSNPLHLREVKFDDHLSKNLSDIINGFSSNVDVLTIFPFKKSLNGLKHDYIDSLKIELVNVAIKDDQKAIRDIIGKIERVIDLKNLTPLEFFAYIYSKYVSYEAGSELLNKTDLRFREIVNNNLTKGKNARFIIKISDIKAPSVGLSDNVEQVLAKRMELKALKELVDDLVLELDKNKLAELDKKIFTTTSKYVPFVYPVSKLSTDISTSVYFIYALDEQQLKDDLRSLGFFGEDKKDTRIAYITCNVNFVSDEVRKLLKKHKFETTDLKYEICDLGVYYAKAKDNMADLIIFLKSDAKQLPSKLGSTLNLFSANVEIRFSDVFLEREYAVLTEGGTAYHINEEEGKKSALVDAFNKVKDKVERTLLAYERDMAKDDKRLTVKSNYLSAKSQSPVTLAVLKSYNVFVNQYKSYSENPVMEISLKNNTGKPLHNIKYSLFVKGYMDFPTENVLELLDVNKSIVLKLNAVFNNKVLELTENSKFQAEIKVSYVLDGNQNEIKAVGVLNIFEKNALIWDDKKKLATFITPRDPNILDISRLIVNNIPNRFINNNISLGVAVFEFLKTYGIKYQQDPNSPYSVVSGHIDAIDYVQYPSDTLKRKTGDCDDLVALLSSLLESLGIKTAFVDFPGHILLMFDSGIRSTEVSYFGLKGDDFVDIDGRLFLPIESTLINSSFYDAWRQGLNLYKKNYNKGLTVTLTEKGWEIYKPPTFELEKLNLSLPVNFQSNYNISISELKKIRDTFVLEYIKNPDYKVENLLYRLFIQGMIDDAITVADIIMRAGYKTPQFYNDTGNLYYYKKRYKEAIDMYKKAYEMSNSYVYIYNIISAYEKLMDKTSARTWEQKLLEIKK
ncbi:MAG: tetratricopeptide repeat protein [Calditerrivibrio sp.]|nr:tetratricopeptide repeat protein [Calditerrivibrio sp.]